MASWIGWSVGALALVGLIGVLLVRSAEHDPEVWHVDPAETTRTGKPNDALAAPVGVTRTEPDIVLATTTKPPPALLAALDAAVRAEPRVEVVAGSVEAHRITYVQRSAIVGFPDYISVSAVETATGTGLVLWSRSRYGYSDLGVNRARLERWLAAARLL